MQTQSDSQVYALSHSYGVTSILPAQLVPLAVPHHANGTTIDPGDYTTGTQESTSPPYLYTTANFENMFSAALNIRSKLFSVVPKALCNLVPAHFSPFQLY